jgi:hypothetical protein
MTEFRMHIRLTPLWNGAYTKVRLTGCVPSSMPPRVLRRFAFLVSGWSGYPLECALCADKESVCWCEWWTALLADIPERHLTIRYERHRGRQNHAKE